jgi:Lon protease-like protein
VVSALVKAPLFPLPHGALLPGELLPLHVFEPRYRALLADARQGSKMIAIATLLPGWEAEYAGAPAVAEIVGLGRMVDDRPRDDGTSDIVLQGLLRAEIAAELEAEKPYRLAGLLPRPDGEQHPVEAWRLRRALLLGIAGRLRTRGFGYDLTAGFDVGALVDRVAAALDLQPPHKVRVMQAVDPYERVELLLALLREKEHRQRLLELIPSLHDFSLSLDTGPRREGGA